MSLSRLGICQKIYTTQFSGERILHYENAQIETIFASNKQQKCIIISNLALFWLKLNKMCKFFNSYEESLHFGMCKLAKYIRNCVVFWKNLHSWQNFTRPPVATVATNSKSGYDSPIVKGMRPYFKLQSRWATWFLWWNSFSFISIQ